MRFELHDVSFGYNHRMLFNHLEVSVEDNTTLTILGPNGVGKTTLLRCMMGLRHWESGCTMIDGRNLTTIASKELWQRMSYVPQAKRSPFSYNLLDMVVMGLNAESKMFSVPSHADYRRAYDVMEWLGIEDYARCNTDEISGGQLQMAFIARALVSEPEALILDEPESNLDMRNQLRVLQAIERIVARGKTTCIINTHYPEHALQLSTSTLFLGAGGHWLLGKTQDVVSERNIHDFYQVYARIIPVGVGKNCRAVYPYRLAEEPLREET
jgi:iron complex transport system ATP-binding protein